jgi:hypothetical protein
MRVAGGVRVGLLLFEFSRVLFWLNSFALLTTVRGGTGGFNRSLHHLCSNMESEDEAK